MSSLTTPIDMYCERLHEGLFAEPLNLLTNSAFLIASFILYYFYKKDQLRDIGIILLIGLVFLIGIGSSIFHSFATQGTMLMDVIPIIFFLLCYIAYFCRKISTYSWFYTAAALILFLVLGYIAKFVPKAYSFNGTISYAPALFFLILMATYLNIAYKAAANGLWIAFILLIISMTFRSIDLVICDSFHIGTHFLWHIFNGLVLYFAVQGLMRVSLISSQS